MRKRLLWLIPGLLWCVSITVLPPSPAEDARSVANQPLKPEEVQKKWIAEQIRSNDLQIKFVDGVYAGAKDSTAQAVQDLRSLGLDTRPDIAQGLKNVEFADHKIDGWHRERMDGLKAIDACLRAWQLYTEGRPGEAQNAIWKYYDSVDLPSGNDSVEARSEKGKHLLDKFKVPNLK